VSDEPQRLGEHEFLARLTDSADLHDVELVGADLSDTNAEQLTLRRCRFVEVTLAHADWEGLTCASCSFVRCQFTGTRLTGASFTHCGFFDADSSRGCSFAGARLRFASFKECTLDSCAFADADLAHLTLTESRAIGATFHKAAFRGSVVMTGNVLRYADLRDADLARCELTGNDFEWANLERAKLHDANLRDASLNRASLSGSDLRRADLRNANLGGLDPRLVELGGALILEGQMRQLLEPLELVILPDNR
jgi:fluoroquinolone resistance protein